MKTCGIIWCVASAALGIFASYGQAHAQTPGCVVVEVLVEGRGAFTQKSPSVDKPSKENEPSGLAQQDANAPLVRVPLPRPREKQRGATDKEDATEVSTREKAFALGQSLDDYCSLKIQSN